MAETINSLEDLGTANVAAAVVNEAVRQRDERDLALLDYVARKTAVETTSGTWATARAVVKFFSKRG